MNNDTVLVSDDGAVRTLTLNRPDKMNALDLAMADALLTAARDAAASATVRCVVLRGAGRGFFAGGDVAEFARHGTRAGDYAGQLIDRYHPSIETLVRMEKPVLAALHGPVAGAGLSLAMTADLAIARDDAVFSLAYSLIGASPDGGSTYFLPRLLGRRRAMEIAMLSDRFDARKALELGLVNRIAPADGFEEAVTDWAQRLAAGPTGAYGRIKRLIDGSLDRDLPGQLAAEREAFLEGAKGPDFQEGIQAFVAKRKPDFEGR